MDSPVWFITAASSGLGQAIALEALSRGHRVIATARNSTKLTKLVEAGAQVLDLDVTADEAVIYAAVDKAFAIHGKITHLVNAAGYCLDGTVEEASREEVFDVFNTNVFGTINVCRAAIPHLRAQGYGAIINFGSLGSWIGGSAIGFYCATKWAVSGFTESLWDELQPFGINVCIVEPGYFRTGFLNAGHRVSTQKQVEAYKGTSAGHWKSLLDSANNNQPGDPIKGAKVMVDVLTRTGVAEGKEIPMRLLIGTDALSTVRQKIKETTELVEEWKKISASTDF